MSTGNSLAYVPNSEITGVLEQMDALVAPGGVLYFDLRNWDRIVRQKQRFYFYDPAFLPNGDRVNLMQVWDHLPDGSITFHLLYTFERAGKIFQKEHFEEHYYPAAQKLLLDQLAQLGRDCRWACRSPFHRCPEKGQAHRARWPIPRRCSLRRTPRWKAKAR